MLPVSYSKTLSSVYQSIQHCVTQHGKLINNYLTVQEILMHFRHNVSSQSFSSGHLNPFKAYVIQSKYLECQALWN